MLCCAVLCCAVLCCAVLCCAVPCCAVLCCAVLCCAFLCSDISRSALSCHAVLQSAFKLGSTWPQPWHTCIQLHGHGIASQVVEEARDIIVKDTEYETAVVGEDVLLTPRVSDEQTDQQRAEGASLQEAGDVLLLSPNPAPSPGPPTPYPAVPSPSLFPPSRFLHPSFSPHPSLRSLHNLPCFCELLLAAMPLL